MTLVNKSDLNRYLSKLEDYIYQGSFGTIAVGNELDNIIESSKNDLTGAGWDRVREKLESYMILTYDIGEVASIVMETAEVAVNGLNNYMEGYDSLDTSNLTELNLKLGRLKTSLHYWQGQKFNKAKMGGHETELVKFEDDSTIAANIRSLDNSIRELEKLIKKIECLDGADGAACAALSGINADLTDFNNRISNI